MYALRSEFNELEKRIEALEKQVKILQLESERIETERKQLIEKWEFLKMENNILKLDIVYKLMRFARGY